MTLVLATEYLPLVGFGVSCCTCKVLTRTAFCASFPSGYDIFSQFLLISNAFLVSSLLGTDSEENGLYHFADSSTLADVVGGDYKRSKTNQTAVVIDNGSYQCKAGWGHEGDPRLCFRSASTRARGKKVGWGSSLNRLIWVVSLCRIMKYASSALLIQDLVTS